MTPRLREKNYTEREIWRWLKIGLSRKSLLWTPWIQNHTNAMSQSESFHPSRRLLFLTSSELLSRSRKKYMAPRIRMPSQNTANLKFPHLISHFLLYFLVVYPLVHYSHLKEIFSTKIKCSCGINVLSIHL